MRSIRRGTLNDLTLLVRHRSEMFVDMKRDTPAQILDQDLRYEPWAREHMQDGTLVAFIAQQAGRAVASGCVWLQPRQPSPRRAGEYMPYLLSMFTERDCRRQGHAKAIVQAALDWARAEGYGSLVLHASEMGRAMYEVFGFRRTWEMEIAIPPADASQQLKDPRRS